MDGEVMLRVEAENLMVHPLADLFPMLPDDELAELADDIATNGLLHPIILDYTGTVLIDGRNRLRACEIAEIEPTFERLAEGVDPRDYIAGANLRRRNMTAGQRAMAHAMLFPEGKQGARTDLQPTSFATNDVAGSSVRKARAVFRHSPDELAPLVLLGKSLDDAYAEVRRRQQAAMSEEAQLARLRTEAPDVADLVVEGSLTLNAGLTELDERARIKRITIEQGHRAAIEIVAAFEAHVAAMVAATELGDIISLNKEEKARLHAAFNLLKARRIG